MPLRRTDDLAVLQLLARDVDASVVDYYEVGARVPSYTIVTKADPKTSAALNLGDQLEPQLRAATIAALSQLSDAIDETALSRAMANRDPRAMLAAIRWDQIDAALQPLAKQVVDAYHQAAVATGTELGDAVGTLGFRFDATSPTAAAWGYQKSADLVTSIGNETRSAIQNAVGRALDADLSRHDATMAIRSVVGLNDVQAGAVDRLRAELIGDGTPSDAIQRATDRYAARLLNQRAHLIARTEIQTAVHAGQRESWNQAADQGLLDRKSTKRVWIANNDACDECDDYNGETIDFDDEFEDGDPPLHPACRCTVGLTFEED